MIQQTHHIGGGARAAAAAGRFYPAAADELRDAVARLMQSANHAQARGELVPGQPKAMIVPHARLDAAGAVAARAYATLQHSYATVQRVVLMGPAHHRSVQGLATPSAGQFDTPLGPVPVDREAVRCLNDLPEVTEHDAAHAAERCLEVHLPFLFHVLGAPRAERGAGSGFRIVPILFGQTNDRQIIHALDRVWGGDETLIIVSADLSHAPDAEAVRRHDRRTVEHILHGKVELLGSEDACGHHGVRGLMRMTWAHRLYPRLLELRHVRDTTDDGRGHDGGDVAGYASFVYC